MPRTRSLAWSELKLGVLTIVAVIIASVTIVMLTGSRGFFWQQYTLKTRFPDVAGLKPGSPVRLAGIPVGIVKSWNFVGGDVDVTFGVNREYGDKITTASRTKLGSISILGESTVDITPATTGTPIPEWGYVPAGPPEALLADVTDQASQGIEQLDGLLKDIRQGKGTVGKLVTDDQVYTELHRTVATLGDLADSIKQGRGPIGKLATDPQMAEELDRSLKNIEGLTTQLSSGEGSLGKLLKDDSFARSLASATDNLNATVAKLNRGEGSLGKALTDTALYDRADSVITRLDQLMTRLNDGEGTAGQLLKDKQLYENMNKVMNDLTSLIAEIEKNPRKFFPNKISIF